MARKRESGLQRAIRAALEEYVGGWWVKIWTGPFQIAGILDLMGCVDGLFFALEVKRPGEEPSEIQKRTMARIRRAGGIACVVTSVKEALDVVRSATGRSEDSGRLSHGKKNRRIIRKTKNG